MNGRRIVWSKVVTTTRYHHPSCPRYALGSYRFDLECGHVVRSKASQGTPKRKRCVECESALGDKNRGTP